MYVKMFRSIFDGSLYGQFEPTVVFMAMLVMAEREGIVDMTPQAIAARAGYPLDIVERGIAELEKPDPRSRTPYEEGRRIVRLEETRDWGWRITNYEKYEQIRSAEERRQYFREKKREQRALLKTVQDVHIVHQSPPPNLHLNPQPQLQPKKLDQDITAAKRPTEPIEFTDIKAIYPKRSGGNPWSKALKACLARLRDGSTWNEMTEGVRRYQVYCRETGKIGTEYVLQAATFFGPDRRFLEPFDLPATKAEVLRDSNIDVSQRWLEDQNAAH